MLLTFLLVPLATNGVLPAVFGYIPLSRRGRAGMGATILTVACWILSSLVYWILYTQLIPTNSDILSEKEKYHAYQQFMYKLSALDACGGYSALAVCPGNFVLGKQEIVDASHNLRVPTPVIWAFSTVTLFAALLGKYLKCRRWCKIRASEMQGEVESMPHSQPPFFCSRFGASTAYAVTTLCFLAGIGMQLSLLAIGTSLNMMNRKEWEFGRIVAVTIWVPPPLQYLYEECKETMGLRPHSSTLPN